MFNLLMSWNIRSGREKDCLEFIVKEFGPGLVQLGIKLTEAWYTQYGDRPQILAGAVSEDLESLQSVLKSDAWRTLSDRLGSFVTDYSQKVIRANGGFQL